MADFRFQYIPYPLWRRHWPAPLRRVIRTICRSFYPVRADTQPPATPRQLAKYLARWNLLGDLSEHEARQRLTENPPDVEMTRADSLPPPAPETPLRLPAQWEPMAAVLLAWPVLYPPLWALHADLVSAISPVADVVILVPRPTWASGIRLFLEQHGQADLSRARFVYLPTDDIWVRDYGPLVGLDDGGTPVAVHTHYQPLPNYPQAADDAMPVRWAAHRSLPTRLLPLYTEGGNLWSDGAGTLLMSDMFERHDPPITRAELEHHLAQAFRFEKLIILPHLDEEETGHIDLVAKLVDAQTVLVTAAGDSINTENLARAAQILRETPNAQGQSYDVRPLPSLRPYYNWGVYPIWRTYTNALTINGRILVPVYGERTDDEALTVYQDACPQFTIIPINCRTVINGGGAVHCLTKEIPVR